jgi:hypothetical protein
VLSGGISLSDDDGRVLRFCVGTGRGCILSLTLCEMLSRRSSGL